MRLASKAQIRRKTNTLILVAEGRMTGRIPVCPAVSPFHEDDPATLTPVFLADTALLVTNPLVPARTVVARNDTSHHLPASLLSLPVIARGENGVGESLEQLFAFHFAIAGAETVCAMGSRTPHLPIAFIIEAFSRLASTDTDVVLGPTDKGNYYLLGMNRMVPELFQNIPWGNPEILAETRERTKAAGIRTALLPPWYEIDTSDDLIQLRHDIERKTVTATGTAAALGL